MFHHILWCLDHYPRNCNFFLVPAYWYRHHGLIDDKILFIEDYVITNDYAVVPSGLITYDVSKQSKVYKFKEVLQKRIYGQDPERIQKTNFKDWIEQALDTTQKRIKRKESVFKEIEKISSQRKVSSELKDIMRRERKVVSRMQRQVEKLETKAGYFNLDAAFKD